MGVQMSHNPNSIVKEGFVQRYKSGLFGSKWKSNYAILYPDSMLALYSERGSSRPAESILLKNSVPYICIGFMTDRMPSRRPELPPGTAVQRLVGIGMDPQASKVHWLLFPSEQILEEWFNAIMTTLPKPANPSPVPTNIPPAGVPTQPPAPTPNAGYVPPAKYPDAPPPAYDYGSGGQTQPQQQPYPTYPTAAAGQPPPMQIPQQYPAQPQQTTVIIDRTGSPAYGRPAAGSSSGFGSGFAAGMGGAMLGGLLGYGLGSMFAPHGGWGGWGGWGRGGGYGVGGGEFGGGYIQDNDTYITNNYYVNNDNDQSTTNNQTTDDGGHTGDYTEPTQNDDYGGNYDGGGGTWDDGGGGDWGDSGGFDGGYDGGGGIDW